MLFNSFPYLFLFLPVVTLVYAALGAGISRRMATYWLILASLVFYGWYGLDNLPILLASVLGNYLFGRALDRARCRGQQATNATGKRILFCAIGANVLLLGYFKYFGHLPLGISFFTLTQIMYLVDVYEGLIGSNTLREHALFATFFPTVTMGPLLRARPMLAQFRTERWQAVSSDQVARALVLLAIGLAKKIVLADSFGRLADAGYASPGSLSMLEAWGSSLSYSLELYYDFSGYSDVAMASAMLLGISIPANFNSPYQSRSIIEFWQRWHMTLSNFITTYLYTPIIRSFAKPTFAAAMFATFVAMLVVGIWHGSTWNFAVFGALHGAALVVAQTWKRLKRRLPTLIAWALTMAFVNLAFVFFRAPTMSAAFAVLSSLGNYTALAGMETWKLHLRTPDIIEIALPILVGVALVFARNSTTIAAEFRPSLRSLGWVTALTAVSLLFLNSNTAKEFIYIDF